MPSAAIYFPLVALTATIILILLLKKKPRN